MKTHVTIEYMVKGKRKRLSRSVLAGIIDGGLMKMNGDGLTIMIYRQ